MDAKTEILEKLYTDPSNTASYGGAERLYRSAIKADSNISRADIKKYLTAKDAYTLHKQIRRRFGRAPTIVSGIDAQWQADLADLGDISKYNDGYRYLLTVVDCFSKYAWAIPVQRKDADTIFTAFQKLFKDAHPRKPKKLQTDKGKEFLNSKLQTLFKKEGVHHFVTHNETKAAMVERFNRTLKSKMYRYFTENDTYRYVNILNQLLEAYNKSVHRTTGVAPVNVTKRNEMKIWTKLYGQIVASGKKLKTLPIKSVRISRSKAQFEKGYLPNWTKEIFNVKSIVNRLGRKVYKLSDVAGEDIEGTFYPEEVQSVIKTENDLYKIEKILKSRKSKVGGKEYFVKWIGWPAKFNTWVLEKDIKNV